ncbi:hypothetical protein GUITHDRAFT_159750 [Guillardia theta CCMP2712]|uniref:homogentisate 1,2-dioxygenase n=1 Tax=Guillardia theta (strain CCMP2712) TaxID=905079 RepID=L1J6V9_GUITC|nr:hypothetical protein GUITHDRAFT_159750 [Guillardia theta CCMP2712]EKX44087.1 hypothetical protein GUITHDRAFT_159750 [Guillardia theta CCMP2712]|eukprot:XP_005831067.1 hypothetical protein GUITHDRAFT_159750 [Guillardia theta CCMP2712]
MRAAAPRNRPPAFPLRSPAAKTYLRGFGNEFESEALPGSLPRGQNNPQRCPRGLYAEQLSGSSFTMTRSKNLRSWLYRTMPTVDEEEFVQDDEDVFKHVATKYDHLDGNPNQVCCVAPLFLVPCLTDILQLRWKPAPLAPDGTPVTFLQGLWSIAGAGDPSAKKGVAIYMYACNTSMKDAFYNSDGDLLIVPQTGSLSIRTEFGQLDVEQNEICVIPRGIVFRVEQQDSARGYMLESFQGHFCLPDLGPIGSNGLANARDFEYPTASFEEVQGDVKIYNKFCGKLFKKISHHSPFNVVAWHGNYLPFKYNLTTFCTMNTVSYDHPDPSIFTVLSCPSETAGESAVDFVIFPPRWMVAEDTFRPPYFHRNYMSEFMGMISGKYDAKVGFSAGGASLHCCMSAHGPDRETTERAEEAEMSPVKFEDGLAFMFETSAILKPTPQAMSCPFRDTQYKVRDVASVKEGRGR